MITRKERNLLIVMLVIVVAVTFILSTAIIIFTVKVEMIENQKPILPEQSTEEQQEETIPETICYFQEILEETIGKEWIIDLTEEEFRDFCMLVYAESGGECIEGQIAVAATIINRIQCADFPNTYFEVRNQRYQFSPVKNGRIISNISEFENLPEKTIEAATRALEGEDPTEELLWEKALELGEDPVKYAEGGALYFYNPKYCSRNPKVVISIGNHNFHKVWEE